MIIIIYIIFLFYILNNIYNLYNLKIFLSNETNIIKYLLIITILINVIEYLHIFKFNISYILDILISVILYFYLKTILNLININRFKIIDKRIMAKEKLESLLNKLSIVYYIIFINIMSILINYFYKYNVDIN